MSPEHHRSNNFSLHVYGGEQGQPHKLPHCHVRRHAGGAETVVALPSLRTIVGPEPSRQEREALTDHRDGLYERWKNLNE